MQDRTELSSHAEITSLYNNAQLYNVFRDLFKALDIELSLDELICDIVKESYQRAEVTHFHLLLLIPRDLMRIILDYINAEVAADALLVPLISTEESKYMADAKKKCTTEFFFTTSKPAAQLVVRFFNRIQPNAAELDEKLHDLSDRRKGMTRLTVSNRALLHEGFKSDITDKVQTTRCTKK